MFERCLFFNLAALWGLSTIDHLCRTSMRTAEQLHWVRILKGIRRWFRDEGACSRPPCAETRRIHPLLHKSRDALRGQSVRELVAADTHGTQRGNGG
jgi:hypothetical protein